MTPPDREFSANEVAFIEKTARIIVEKTAPVLAREICREMLDQLGTQMIQTHIQTCPVGRRVRRYVAYAVGAAFTAGVLGGFGVDSLVGWLKIYVLKGG